jgi:hypothetical protein
MAPLCFEHLAESHWIFRGIMDDLRADSERRVAEQKPEPRPAKGLVYFVRLGNRIKIGYTTNMKARMVAVPHEEVLGTVPGTMTDERRCHAAFAHLREHGEWFRAEPDLLKFIEDLPLTA